MCDLNFLYADILFQDSAGRLTFRNYVSQLVTAARPLLNNEPLLLQMFEVQTDSIIQYS